MTITQLEYFIALAEKLNFTRVAEQFYISQTAVSQQIKTLENQIGFALFRRDKRHVELTAGGRIYYNEVKAVLLRLKEAEHYAKQVQEGYEGVLRIGFLPGMEGSILSTTIQDFISQYPGVKLELQSGVNEALVQKVKEGSIDVAFTFLSGHPDAALQYQPFRQIPHYVLLHKKHYLSYRRVLHRIDLQDETILMIRAAKEDMLQAFEQSGYTPQHIRFADDMSALIMMLTANLGVTVLPEYNMKMMSSLDMIQQIPLADTGDQFQMCAVSLHQFENVILSKFFSVVFPAHND